MERDGIKVVASSVVIMLCLGSIYAWSIYVPHLMDGYGYSNVQTQIIFGSFIGIFTLTMVLGRGLFFKHGPRFLGIVAAVIYALGYLLAYFSKADFFLLYTGIAVLSGVATGFGYLISISVPVEWFPKKKGLIMGLVSAGFGGGAILESLISQQLFSAGIDLLTVFLIVGISKGLLILGASFFIKRPAFPKTPTSLVSFKELLRDKKFIQLFIGIFTGTFSGLLIIGNLKHIGMQYPIDYQILVLGITVFSIANFTGRLFWGWLNDFVSGRILIPLSLLIAGVFTLGIGYIQLNAFLYLLLAFIIGFTYAASFVIYANETAQIYGLNNLSRIYPFIFLGYGISGVIGPFTGGLLHDMFGNYQYPALVSSLLCIIVFLILVGTGKKNVLDN